MLWNNIKNLGLSYKGREHHTIGFSPDTMNKTFANIAGTVNTPTLPLNERFCTVTSINYTLRFTLRQLWIHSAYTPRCIKIMLVKTLILSHLFYGDIIFSK